MILARSTGQRSPRALSSDAHEVHARLCRQGKKRVCTGAEAQIMQSRPASGLGDGAAIGDDVTAATAPPAAASTIAGDGGDGGDGGAACCGCGGISDKAPDATAAAAAAAASVAALAAVAAAEAAATAAAEAAMEDPGKAGPATTPGGSAVDDAGLGAGRGIANTEAFGALSAGPAPLLSPLPAAAVPAPPPASSPRSRRSMRSMRCCRRGRPSPAEQRFLVILEVR